MIGIANYSVYISPGRDPARAE